MKTKLLIVLRKELRETLREKRTLATLVVMTLLYPVIIGLTLTQRTAGDQSHEDGCRRCESHGHLTRTEARRLD